MVTYTCILSAQMYKSRHFICMYEDSHMISTLKRLLCPASQLSLECFIYFTHEIPFNVDFVKDSRLAGGVDPKGKVTCYICPLGGENRKSDKWGPHRNSWSQEYRWWYPPQTAYRADKQGQCGLSGRGTGWNVPSESSLLNINSHLRGFPELSLSREHSAKQNAARV